MRPSTPAPCLRLTSEETSCAACSTVSRPRTRGTSIGSALRFARTTLGLDSETLGHAEQRIGIGAAHERADIDSTFCISAHASSFGVIAKRLARHWPKDSARLAPLLVTLHRILSFDSGLVVEAYVRLKRHRLEVRINELVQSRRSLVAATRRDSITQIDGRGFLMTSLRKELERSQRF